MSIKPKPTSVLSLDVGKKRIGLAGCDQLGITSKALPAIHRKSIVEDLKILNEYCKERNVKGLVVGIPLDEKGRPTRKALALKAWGFGSVEAARNFANRHKKS